jgi:hypothetical protein
MMSNNRSTSGRGSRPRQKVSPRGRQSAFNQHNQDFRCGYCQAFVSADSLLAGVKNRNHCPYCLRSKHVDSKEAGDRLAACKGLMHPVGLTIKKTRKKYGPETGELMLIHRCEACSRLSINRIAADDSSERVIEVFKNSFTLEPELKVGLEESGIQPLAQGDEAEVRKQLFGSSPSEEEETEPGEE